MTRRLTAALLWTLVLVLLVLPIAGCSRSSSSSPVPSASPAVTLPPSPVSTDLARTDPAAWAAARFEQARCSWDWHRPRAAYVAAQQALATPGYGKKLAATADPTSWREEVVAGKQEVTCTVGAPHRLVGAPVTSTSVYVRMSVAEHVTSMMGSFDTGARIASWVVQRVDGRWMVAGTFDGG
jgi:hypothetical protein